MGIGFLENHRQVAVVALGGNAILRKGQDATPEIQRKNIADALVNLEPLLDKYDAFALTHGNGPQVGNDILRSLAAEKLENLPRISLADCGANTQGRVGNWIVLEMARNRHFSERKVANLITHVFVDKNEFTKEDYTKYIGPWLPSKEIDVQKELEKGIVYKTPDGQTDSVRRVVPSPVPYRIAEIDVINDILGYGAITICCGGGGIPVYDPAYEGNLDKCDPSSKERFIPSDVVIDKDYASAVLAASLSDLNPDWDVHLLILTDVKGLYQNAELRPEDFIGEMSLEEIENFIQRNSLDAGSIRPKLEAIRYFLRKGGKHAYLGSLTEFDPDNPGTHFFSVEQIKLFRKA
jgi:carbamate kinase